MTAGVELDHDAVRRAAQYIGGAGDAVAGTQHADDVDRVSAAMPGSLSAAAAGRLAGAWRTSTDAWADAARGQRQRLDAAVTASAAADGRAAQNLDRLTARLGAPTPR